jgi:hypothetical protein
MPMLPPAPANTMAVLTDTAIQRIQSRGKRLCLSGGHMVMKQSIRGLTTTFTEYA